MEQHDKTEIVQEADSQTIRFENTEIVIRADGITAQVQNTSHPDSPSTDG